MKCNKLQLDIYSKVLFAALCTIVTLCSSPITLRATKASSSIHAGEQKKSEKGLRDNKYFIYYINASISNTGSDDDKNKFETAVKHNIVAQFYYLRLSFGDSYKEIRKAQNILIELYRSNLESEITDTRVFLHGMAADVIYSEDARARLYLNLGYRHLKHGASYMNMADHYKRTLFSLRLYQYVRAMKKVKEAKRYAVAALLQTRLEDKELLITKHHSFKEIAKLIEEHAKEDEKAKAALFLTDSYYKFTGEMSEFERVWEDPELSEFNSFKEYLEKSE